MKNYSLAQIDDLSTIISLGNGTYTLRLYAFRELIYADVLENDKYVVSGKRVMLGEWIIPPYLVQGRGNIRFEAYAADSDDYVWYTGYNTKFRLVGYTAKEILGGIA